MGFQQLSTVAGANVESAAVDSSVRGGSAPGVDAVVVAQARPGDMRQVRVQPGGAGSGAGDLPGVRSRCGGFAEGGEWVKSGRLNEMNRLRNQVGMRRLLVLLVAAAT